MNINSYCRLCALPIHALPRQKLLQIFDEEGFKLHIVESINKILKIEICEKDHLPRGVCLSCNEKLTSTRQFIDASFQAQETLLRILEETHLLKEENCFSLDGSFGDASEHSTTATDSLASVLEQENEISSKALVTIDDVDSSLLEEYVDNLSTGNGNCLNNDHNFSRNQSKKPEDQIPSEEYPRALSIFTDARCNSSGDKTSSSSKTDREKYQAVSQINAELEILRVEKPREDASSRGTIRVNTELFECARPRIESCDEEVVEVTDESRSEREAEVITDSNSSSESVTVIKVEEIKYSSVKKVEKVEGAVDRFDDSLWPCAQCDHRCAKYDDLRLHYSCVHGVPVKYMCPVCSKKFVKSTNFYAHLKKHKPACDNDDSKSTKNKLSCDDSSKEFSNRKLLDTLMTVNSDVDSFPCDECGKNFRHLSLLQLHARCHLPADLKNKFQCDLCSKRFSTKPNLITHRRIHSGVRNYTCDQCGKSFIQKGNLDAHMLTHSSDKPFSCDICEKGFKTMLQLRKHHSVHTGAKPHQCDVCGRMFRERGTLREHYRIHTGAMPFSCEFCGKSFRFKGILTTHRRQHTGEKPYSCQECQHHFTNWPNYNKHMKRGHGINTSKTSRVKTDPTVPSSSPAKPTPTETEPLAFPTSDITGNESFDQCIDSLAAEHILSNNFYVATPPNSSSSSYVHPFLSNGSMIGLYNLATSVAPMDAMGFGQVIDVMASAHPQLR